MFTVKIIQGRNVAKVVNATLNEGFLIYDILLASDKQLSLRIYFAIVIIYFHLNVTDLLLY